MRYTRGEKFNFRQFLILQPEFYIYTLVSISKNFQSFQICNYSSVYALFQHCTLHITLCLHMCVDCRV